MTGLEDQQLDWPGMSIESGLADYLPCSFNNSPLGRHGAGLALEPLLQIGIGGDVLGEDFDGDGAVQAHVAGLIDLPHAARAEGGLDLVGAERGAGSAAPGPLRVHVLHDRHRVVTGQFETLRIKPHRS